MWHDPSRTFRPSFVHSSEDNHSYGFLHTSSHAEFLLRMDIFCSHNLACSWISSSSQQWSGTLPRSCSHGCLNQAPDNSKPLGSWKWHKGGTRHFRDLSKTWNIWLACSYHYITGGSSSGSSNFPLRCTLHTKPSHCLSPKHCNAALVPLVNKCHPNRRPPASSRKTQKISQLTFSYVASVKYTLKDIKH